MVDQARSPKRSKRTKAIARTAKKTVAPKPPSAAEAAVAQQNGKLRDSAKPAAYFVAAIALYEEKIQDELGRKAPQLYGIVSERYIRVAKAKYCLGESRAECLSSLEEAVRWRRNYYVDGRHLKFTGMESVEVYLEAFAAAHLTNSTRELIDAYRGITWHGLEPWEERLMRLLGDTFIGESTKLPRAELDNLKKKSGFYKVLVELLLEVQQKEAAGFQKRLEAYLVSCWGVIADKAARGDLSSGRREYTGKWCIFSAALCDLVAQAPRLSPKAMQYIPIDLLAVSA